MISSYIPCEMVDEGSTSVKLSFGSKILQKQGEPNILQKAFKTLYKKPGHQRRTSLQACIPSC